MSAPWFNTMNKGRFVYRWSGTSQSNDKRGQEVLLLIRGREMLDGLHPEHPQKPQEAKDAIAR